jgi:predicted small lipoprotein YifL
MTIRRITSEWPFLSTTTCGAMLASSQTCTVTVAYSPLNQAALGTSPPFSIDTGTLVIESDAVTSPDLIALTGAAAPLLVSSPDNTALLVSFTASQSSLVFPSTSVGNISAGQIVTLLNTGTRTIHLTAFQTTPDFTVADNCAALVPGAACTLTITFTPQFSGTRISALEISSDASTALEFISLLGTATPSSLVFSPVLLNFGTIRVGNTSRLSTQVTNSGHASATFNGISVTGDYVTSGTCPTPGGTIPPSENCTIQVAFTPTQSGPRDGTIRVASSVSALPLTIPLTGSGSQSSLKVEPASLNFGSLALGVLAKLSFTLSNTGSVSVTSLAFSITGDYAITTPCALTVLAPGDTCTVTVSFAPTALGTRAGTLNITNADTSSPVILPLSGTGVPDGSFTLTVNGGASTSVSVKSGSPATYPLMLTPRDNFSGTVILNCTPISPGQYATCSLLPSSISLGGTAQNSAATINTVTSASTTARSKSHLNRFLLCFLPAALFFFRKTRLTLRYRSTLLALLAVVTLLSLNGCGSGGSLGSPDPNLRKTPSGTYQYQITATATTGIQVTQSVILNLTVQ